jgi:hypothetical protein
MTRQQTQPTRTAIYVQSNDCQCVFFDGKLAWPCKSHEMEAKDELLETVKKAVEFLDKGPDMRPDVFIRGVWDTRELLRSAIAKREASK